MTAPETCACPEGVTASRRTFLKGLGLVAGAVAGGPMLGARVSYAADPAYAGDVLVVLSLRGAADGMSIVAPVGDPDYARLRPTIAVPAATGLPTGDRRFALHPALAPLLPLWKAGTLGAIHAVGTPDGSRSHFQATEELERAAPGSSIRTGWLDRVTGTRPGAGVLSTVQVGSGSPGSLLAGPNPELAAGSLKDFSLYSAEWVGPRLATALSALHAADTGPAGAAARTTLAAVGRVGGIVAADPAPHNGAVYPKGELGEALADTARLVRAEAGLRSVCLDLGDWDMHTDLGRAGTGRMAEHAGGLAQALAAFAKDLGSALGRVTVVTISEFGRRAAENGSGGLDHGHGNVMLVMGGGTAGGRVHGRWPGLSPAALDHGDLAGTTDYRNVLGELLVKRCGVPQASLGQVFPGLTPSFPGVVATAR